MTQPSQLGASIVLPDAAPVVRAFGDELHFHLTGEQTGGRYTLFTDITPPGGGPPPHYHANEDETFCVLEGRAEFLIADRWVQAPAGTVVHAPRGVRHAFRNPTDQPLKQLISTAPSGFENFFRKSESEFNRPGGPDMKHLASIAEQHGIFFDPPTP